MRLQAQASLDSDLEDANGLEGQFNAGKSYLTRLRSACEGILTHYEERKSRREANLKALQNAKSIINIENADEIHQKLASLAQDADDAAAGLTR